MTEEIDTKLSAARTRLILDRPFLGALVLRLPLVVADPSWCRTSATDTRTLFYNQAYIKALTIGETQFVLAHEALHCALSHFTRRGHRNKHRWDLACDFAINPLLVAEGLQLTPDALMLEQFHGMTAEEIYPCLDEFEDYQSEDQHLYDDSQSEGGQGGDAEPDSGIPTENQEQGGVAGCPPPMSQDQMESLATQWRQRMAGAAQQALQAGKLGGAMARMVDHLLQPQLPWRMLLARFVTAMGRDDYSYSRPSRREGSAILPSLRSNTINVTIFLDSSGSVSDEEMREFLSEVDALKGQVNARVTLHACDVELAPEGPWVFESWEELELPQNLGGGGGTSFVPACIWLEKQDLQPDLVLYFTDAEGEFPKREPVIPVVWLVKGKSPVPWGERIQLN